MDKLNSNRNRSKDNPYVLSFDNNKNTYIVEFKDNLMITHKVEISEDVYKAFDKFELEDISQIHKYKKHIEHLELSDEDIQHRMINKPRLIEDEVESNVLIDELKMAINELTDVQKRRLKMYYFENKTLQKLLI